MRDATVVIGIREPKVFLQGDTMLLFQFIQRKSAVAIGVEALPRGVGRDMLCSIIFR